MNKTSSGFHRFYGYFLNGEVPSITQAPFSFNNAIVNLYSSLFGSTYEFFSNKSF